MLKIYDASTDVYREATQNDIDDLQKACFELVNKINVIREVAKLNIVADANELSQIKNIVYKAVKNA